MDRTQPRNVCYPASTQQVYPATVSSFHPTSTVRGVPSVDSTQTVCDTSTKRLDSRIPDKVPSAIFECAASKHNEEELELELEEIFVGNIRQSTCKNGEQIDVITLEDSSDLSGLFDDDNAGTAGIVGFRHNQKSVALSPPLPLIQPLKVSSSRPGVTVSPVPSNCLRDSNDSLSRSSRRLDRSPSCSPHPDQQRFKPYHEEKWNLRLSELKQYRREHGSCLVPHTYPKNPQLARWTKRQRRQYKLYKSGRASTMTPERLQLLEEIGFVWDSHEACWQERLQELAAYKLKFGNCLVPSNYKKNPQLATWVKCQRRQYKLYWLGRASAMTPDRIVKLEGLGFEWEIRSSASSMDGSDYLMLSQAISNL